MTASVDLYSAETRRLAREYFSLLDRRANPALSPLDMSLESAVRRTWVALKQRVLRRAAHHSTAMTLSGPWEKGDTGAVRRISQLMVELLANVFGSPIESPLRLRDIACAHDMFSWGGLGAVQTPGIRASNSVPDGAAIFFFPEFAHLAIEHGVDYFLWWRLLPALTRMPAIYLRVCELTGEPAMPRAFDSYGPPVSGVDEDTMMKYVQRLVEDWNGLGIAELEQKLDFLAARAFADSI